MKKNNKFLDYIKAIELGLEETKAYRARGIAKGKIGDYEGAIQDYNKAIELNPNDPDIYYNRGVAKYNLGDYAGTILEYDKAIEYASIAIDIAPNMHQAHQILALAYAGKKDKETAEKYYQKCIINGTKSSKEIRNMMDNLYAGDDTVISE